ncbi:hypothetical protein D3C81_432360 [compost metagenome]
MDQPHETEPGDHGDFENQKGTGELRCHTDTTYRHRKEGHDQQRTDDLRVEFASERRNQRLNVLGANQRTHRRDGDAGNGIGPAQDAANIRMQETRTKGKDAPCRWCLTCQRNHAHGQHQHGKEKRNQDRQRCLVTRDRIEDRHRRSGHPGRRVEPQRGKTDVLGVELSFVERSVELADCTVTVVTEKFVEFHDCSQARFLLAGSENASCRTELLSNTRSLPGVIAHSR